MAFLASDEASGITRGVVAHGWRGVGGDIVDARSRAQEGTRECR
jgi:hypothetical protein